MACTLRKKNNFSLKLNIKQEVEVLREVMCRTVSWMGAVTTCQSCGHLQVARQLVTIPECHYALPRNSPTYNPPKNHIVICKMLISKL